MKSMKKTGGLRRRWLLNTVGVVFALGLVCVMAVTASYATYYYSNMQSDMENRAKTTTDFFADYINQDYGDYYQSCITYAKTFEDKGKIELQFINNQGSLVASSYGPWAGPSPSTSDIWDAISIRDKSSYIGRDPDTGERIMAVSCPMIYSNGEVIGVLRYVTSTRLVNRQIILVCLVAVCADGGAGGGAAQQRLLHPLHLKSCGGDHGKSPENRLRQLRRPDSDALQG